MERTVTTHTRESSHIIQHQKRMWMGECALLEIGLSGCKHSALNAFGMQLRYGPIDFNRYVFQAAPLAKLNMLSEVLWQYELP